MPTVIKYDRCIKSKLQRAAGPAKVPSTQQQPLSFPTSIVRGLPQPKPIFNSPLHNMVFQSNHARRASNSENVYPSSYRRSSSKRYSSFRNGAQSPSRRRRARTTGNNNPRSPVQRSYRRAITRTSTAAVRFDIAREVTDVEVNDTETRGEAGSSSQKTPITLPRWLDRPNYKEVRRETLVAIDPEFVDVPLEYIQIGLESTGLA
jgi:hypothetical protein